ncbi:MAG: hypothetical protein KGV44_07930 [Flavobacteriaceae bacterium]|nr:hypothetical protein [Flavobacteriaceae bacterium]
MSSKFRGIDKDFSSITKNDEDTDLNQRFVLYFKNDQNPIVLRYIEENLNAIQRQFLAQNMRLIVIPKGIKIETLEELFLYCLYGRCYGYMLSL